MEPIRISAVIITFNESKNIARCLQSLAGVVDEIVVVDSFSTDDTVAICKTFGVKIIQHAWMGYTAQKNMGNAQAQHSWVLSVDADEAISEELKKSILQLKQLPTADGYIINRLTNYCGHWVRHGDWYPDAKLRLWHKDKGQWGGNIHEEVKLVEPSKIGTLQGDLLHYSYYSVLDHVAQMQKFTELMAQDNVAKNKKSSLFKILLSPAIKFFKSYFIRLGFLDGYHGYIIAKMSAHATFLKYVRTLELQKNKTTNNKLQ